MHPSSFYDLQSRYIYTPLYGPYTMLEALEGLIFYSLDKSWDSVSIGSKRALWHELILELSNVIDDLQDYLVYFSSEFLISPFNSLDFIKELQGRHNGFKCVSSCWGAIITCLAVARKIIEGNFWPHLFRPTINNWQAVHQRLRQLPSLSPNTVQNKSIPSTSTLIPSSHMDSTPRTMESPLEMKHLLLLNAQSERPQIMSSKLNPMGSKEHHVLSFSVCRSSLQDWKYT